MLVKGWVNAQWGITAGNRRARYYQLTPAGRKQLARERSQWTDFVEAVALVMGPAREAKR